MERESDSKELDEMMKKKLNLEVKENEQARDQRTSEFVPLE